MKKHLAANLCLYPLGELIAGREEEGRGGKDWGKEVCVMECGPKLQRNENALFKLCLRVLCSVHTCHKFMAHRRRTESRTRNS